MSDASLQPILALLGYPVAGNPTQFMMEKAFAQHQLDYRFLTLEIAPDSLGDAVAGMRAMGFFGAICTSPHKQAIVAHLPKVTPAATTAGAVNLVYREEGELVGDNTEGRSMVAALGRLTDVAGKRIVILGAGSVARAIAAELALAKVAEIRVVNRSEEHAQSLVDLLSTRLQTSACAVRWEGDYEVPADTNILIHATSIAQGDDEAAVPLEKDSLRPEFIVADVTFNPPRTALLEHARHQGCKTIDGLELFLLQAAAAIQKWSGVEPDLTVMREAVEEFLLL